MHKWVYIASLVAAASAVFSVACGSDDDGGANRNLDSTGTVTGEISVFAASSLTDAFMEEAAAFERANPGVKVTMRFGASSALAVQINEGAPADVYASADLAQMKVVTDAGAVSESKIFVKNTPVVVIPRSDTKVASFAELAMPGVRLVLAGAEVPIGRYSREILRKASAEGGVSSDFSERVLANLKSEEANVRAV
ncbi:MAG: molybdate ABC transporter substrate-binding protein, partial [Tepidiformaceae bacterium]